jgi:plastocyanin
MTWVTLFICLASLSMMVVACGGGSAGGDQGGGAGNAAESAVAAAVTSGPKQTITADQISFDRDEIVVPAGAEIELTFVNDDLIAHNFAVYDDAGAPKGLFSGEAISGPSKTIVYKFQAPAPGEYVFLCEPHRDTMVGRFIVR